MKRREFIKSSVVLPTAATLAATVPPASAAEKSTVARYNPLGGTEIRMSDISFGTGRLPSASMILRGIDRGINYFDTAPDYGNSEEYIGEAMKRFKQRDKIYIASKFCHDLPFEAGVSHLQVGSSKEDYKHAVEDSLRRLNTDYLDVVFVHAIGERNDYPGEHARLFDPNMLEAVEELKTEGKMRYLAVSSHGPYNMEKLLGEAVESGHFDVIMPAFNFMKFPKVPEVLREARARGVGVVAMKTLAGARDMDLDPRGAVFEHAAFKWVLQHPEVAGLVVTMKRVKDMDLYLQASGTEFSAADQYTLDRYAARFGSDYCRTGCSDCETNCPAKVPIASILRYQMYFENYADEKLAMQSYAALECDARACLDCATENCVDGCGYRLPVAMKLRAAHGALTFEGTA
jgi:aryl-alcohol dehydrogenase-like predicted oxidoreductase